MTRIEIADERSFEPSRQFDRDGLSRSAQFLFQSLADLNVNAELPPLLDMGSMADLYQLAAPDVIATRLPKELGQGQKEREVPTVGKPVPLKDFLEMDSPIGDACREGKSKTLNSLAAEMGKRPWTIYAVVNDEVAFQDYDAKDSTITLGTKWSNEKKVDNFAHEAYHATHQDLDKLFTPTKPIGKDDYMRIKMDQEAGSFLAEYKVNRELGHTVATSYEYADGSEVRHKAIGDLIVYTDPSRKTIDEKASRAAIGAFLTEHHAPIRNPDGRVERDIFTGQIHTYSYPKQHELAYEKYSNPDNFDINRAKLVRNGWLGKNY